MEYHAHVILESVMKKRSKWVARGRMWPMTGPVANHASVGKGVNRKMRARQEARVKDYKDFMSKPSSELPAGINKRRDGGGFHQPGSNK